MPDVEAQLRTYGRWAREQIVPVDLPSLDRRPPVTAVAAAEPERRIGQTDDEPVYLPAAPRRGLARRGQRRWLAVAAAAVAVLILATVAVVASRTGRSAGPADGGLGPTGVDRVLGPAQPPPGLQLFGLSWPGSTHPNDINFRQTAPVTELFGSGGQAQLELSILRASSDVSGRPGSPVEVRGGPGSLRPPGVRAAGTGASPVGTIDWTEKSALLHVDFKGLTSEKALGFVDRLVPRATDPIAGFDAPAGGPLDLVVPPRATDGPAKGTEASFVYTDAPGSTHGLIVVTCPEGADPCAGDTGGLDYATVWFDGSRRSDRTAVSTAIDGAGYAVAWPDGGFAYVAPVSGRAFDRTVARNLVAGLVRTDTAALRAARQQISDRIAALPVVARARTGAGAVEVHGTGRQVGYCFEPPGSALVCPPIPLANPPASFASLSIVSSGAMVGRAWYVIGATRDQGRLTITTGPGLSGPRPDAAVSVDGIQIVLARMPDAISTAVPTLTTANSSRGGQGLARPLPS